MSYVYDDDDDDKCDDDDGDGNADGDCDVDNSDNDDKLHCYMNNYIIFILFYFFWHFQLAVTESTAIAFSPAWITIISVTAGNIKFNYELIDTHVHHSSIWYFMKQV